MHSVIREARNDLHAARVRMAAAVAADAEEYRRYTLSAAHTELVDAKAEVSLLEERLRTAVLDEYDGTNKNPCPGVSVAERTVLEYDPEEALKWAIEHRLALKLDEPKFKKLAADLDFVATKVVPFSKIATDLSPFVANDEEDNAVDRLPAP